jgi:hypothetical protein
MKIFSATRSVLRTCHEEMRPAVNGQDQQPRRGLSPLRWERELGQQQKQLDRRRNIDLVNQSLYVERSAQVQARRAQAMLRGVLTIPRGAKEDTVLSGRFGRLCQVLLTKLVHPAASWLPPRAMAVGQSSALIARGLGEGWAKRVTFWADDEGAALLDGLLVAKGSVDEAADKPYIIVVVGFAMTYEAIVRQAKSFADDLDVVVVLHNSRGVGRSLGTQYTIDQAVEDCKAVIRSLRTQGHTHLGAYGISMGSAVLFRAIEEMSATGELHAGDIGLAASVRGLSSIPSVVGAHTGFLFASISRWLLRSVNLPEMDVACVLRASLLATELMVTTADNDWLVKGKGQLVRALNLPGSGLAMLASGQKVTIVPHHGDGHVDPEVRTAEHDIVLQRWAHRARARGKLLKGRFI